MTPGRVISQSVARVPWRGDLRDAEHDRHERGVLEDEKGGDLEQEAANALGVLDESALLVEV